MTQAQHTTISARITSTLHSSQSKTHKKRTGCYITAYPSEATLLALPDNEEAVDSGRLDTYGKSELLEVLGADDNDA